MKNKITLGDCFEWFPAIEDNSVDMIFADLPFGRTQASWDKPLPMQLLWPEYWRVLKPDGAIILKAQPPFNVALGASQIDFYRYDWIWEKGNATGHLNANRAPMKAHENLMVFYKKQPYYNPQKTVGHERKTAKRKVHKTEIYGSYGAANYDSTERFPRSVLRFSSDKQKSKLHPTQTPVALIEYMIKTYTREGETVLDNCSGSGSTAEACINTKRNYICIEKELKFFNDSCGRIRKAISIN